MREWVSNVRGSTVTPRQGPNDGLHLGRGGPFNLSTVWQPFDTLHKHVPAFSKRIYGNQYPQNTHFWSKIRHFVGSLREVCSLVVPSKKGRLGTKGVSWECIWKESDNLPGTHHVHSKGKRWIAIVAYHTLWEIPDYSIRKPRLPNVWCLLENPKHSHAIVQHILNHYDFFLVT